jgi:hypothetical protein
VTPASVQALGELGLSLDSFVRMTIAMDILVASVYIACALIIFIRKPNEVMSIFVTIMLVTFGAVTSTGALRGLAALGTQWVFLVRTIELIGNCCMVAFLFLFIGRRHC